MEAYIPLARTLASSLNSTAKIFPMWPDMRLTVVPATTSHKKTERSPPADANLLLSCDLEYSRSTVKFTVTSRGGSEENSHADGEHFIPVRGVSLDLSTQAWIPQPYCAVLPACEYIFG